MECFDALSDGGIISAVHALRRASSVNAVSGSRERVLVHGDECRTGDVSFSGNSGPSIAARTSSNGTACGFGVGSRSSCKARRVRGVPCFARAFHKPMPAREDETGNAYVSSPSVPDDVRFTGGVLYVRDTTGVLQTVVRRNLRSASSRAARSRSRAASSAMPRAVKASIRSFLKRSRAEAKSASARAKCWRPLSCERQIRGPAQPVVVLNDETAKAAVSKGGLAPRRRIVVPRATRW